MKSNKEAKGAAERFKRLHPDGATVFCSVLADMLDMMGDQPGGHRIEHWTSQDWDGLADSLNETLKSVASQDYLYRELPQRIAEQGGDKDTLKAYRAEMRKHIAKVRPEALRVLATFRERLEGSAPHVRAQYIVDVYAWHKAWRDPNVPDSKKRLVLAALTRADVLENAPSDHLTMQVHRAIQSGAKAFGRQEGFDFPVATGKARPGTEHEEVWSYELAPVLDPARPNDRPLLPAPDLAEKVVGAMTAYSQRLGDRDSDLLFLLMDRFASRAKHPDDRVRVTLDELMESLGFSKHASGNTGESYRIEDKTEVRRRVEELQSAWMTVNKAVKIKGQRHWDHASSRVLVIFDKLGQREIGQPEHEPVRAWNAIVIGFGRAWSNRLFDAQGRLVMALQTRALQYHPTKQVYEKRIAKALGFYWRANLERAAARYRILDVVAEQLGEAPQSFTRRQAERLEEALDRLQTDKMIGAWRYRDGVRLSELQRMPTGWLDRWLEREVVIEPPAELVALYQAKHKKLTKGADEPEPMQPEGVELGAAFKAYRTAHGISQLKAAEMLGIDNSTLSKIERGRMKPTQAAAARMASLLRDLKARPELRREAAQEGRS